VLTARPKDTSSYRDELSRHINILRDTADNATIARWECVALLLERALMVVDNGSPDVTSSDIDG